jgi:hypothetical protein
MIDTVPHLVTAGCLTEVNVTMPLKGPMFAPALSCGGSGTNGTVNGTVNRRSSAKPSIVRAGNPPYLPEPPAAE